MIHEIILNIFGSMEVIVWAWAICQMKFVRKKQNWIIAGIIFGLSWTMNMYIPVKDVIIPFQQLGYMVATVMIFEGKMGRRLLQYWFSLFYFELIYLPIRLIIFVIGLFREQFLQDVVQRYILCFLGISIVLFIGKRLKKYSEICIWIKNISNWYFVLGIVCSMCANLTAATIRMSSAEWNMTLRIIIEVTQTVVLIFFYLLGIGVAFVNLWKEQYKRESALKDKYLQMSDAHYKELEAHIREVRSIRHDIKNHLYILENYLKEGKEQQAQNYLQEIKEHQEWKNKPIVNVGNELVNAVLADGLGKDESVRFICEGILPPELEMADYDLCTIFSNLLSNSVEACGKLPDIEKKIYLSIRSFQDKLLVSIKNPAIDSIKIEKLGTFTSKKNKEKHGYGIYNIKQTVEKYHGEIQFQMENENFCVRIELPIISNWDK